MAPRDKIGSCNKGDTWDYRHSSIEALNGTSIEISKLNKSAYFSQKKILPKETIRKTTTNMNMEKSMRLGRRLGGSEQLVVF